MQQNIVILGSTGSIGKSTLSVIEHNSEKYRTFALVGGRNAELMAQQCLDFQPHFAVMADSEAAKQLKQRLSESAVKTEVLSGEQAICEIAAHPEADCVMAAIVGAAGLRSTLAAIQAGKRVLLANKESLVTCGQLFIDEVAKSGATLLPVDSEHNAIFQALPQSEQQRIGHCRLHESGIERIILTGSGGPFRHTALEDFAALTPAQAVAHPNWSMGHKISVDSATMMNKGLEYIEARWLFNASAEQMEIIIHPQSIIHSMVRYSDGSVLAQMGNPDMRTPIAHTLAYPDRTFAGVAPLDFFKLKELTFIEPDYQRYPNLKLAIDCFAAGQYATTVMNAANEVAVAAFLQGQIRFTDIEQINRRTVEQFPFSAIKQIEDVFEIDQKARRSAQQLILAF
ncbi:1-deoxy-D-xylulose 5-phosphate reductoisomerase [Pasteurella testudinis DSM 23072]|uniref:1-deoxy-D-xylulose 5-phosphate reductoisomerase n=1 Tax=Pasteurella testudinis DSM 23072 TaxID=1122938 RepID=A0A1W1UAC4_9PAST|nr:1-deoxy-D-xylulose-5-phosphate reductoisomerase [Pasteurella testudinis]SMB78019.1 1-deoxy-D-xylulose 5-phosphate reductoisomerase [Pasteurella testudinis DSM 23072]SUB52711.1 1-deoxy-D-xylulose 5-phosphate reductoisomerase [Pasteurella testudinis]